MSKTPMIDPLVTRRDPARRGRILNLIEGLWLKYPDLRLGQLLVNAAPEFERRPFFFEDSDLEQELSTGIKTE
mgnify:FL=1